MLHFIAFKYNDNVSVAQLRATLNTGDVLVFCEQGLHWPEQHELKTEFEFIGLNNTQASEQLADWLEQHNALYWPAIDTADAS